MSHFEQHLEDMYEDFFLTDSLYGEFAKRFGESYTSMSILYLLGEHPEGISQKQLARELFQPKQTVGPIVSGFEKRGLADHKPDTEDKRSKLHFLTPAGTRHCDEVMGTLRRIELRCVEQVGAEDMARMHDISTRYLTLFKQELDS